MKVLGLIPARGGSKGVPGKNIKKLCGKPLIEYSIEAALKSDRLSEVVVSTDDEEIAKVSRNAGASVPFPRPEPLARDSSPTIDAVLHAVKNLAALGSTYDAVCLLQPTNPLISSAIIDKSISKFEKTTTDSMISVREIPHNFNPFWAFVEDSNDCLVSATGSKNFPSRRQDLQKAYHRDGVIYLVRTEIIIKQKSLYGNSIGYINLSNETHVNIDTMKDWENAEKVILES